VNHKADLGRVFASGERLHTGQMGKQCEFIINTLNAGSGPLALAVNGGPAKVQHDYQKVTEGYKVGFIPLALGDYFITIKFNDKNINGNPFKCRIGSQSLD
jgi:filamin